MKELGYTVRRGGQAGDIAGLERETIEKFSRRTAEIEALAEELGIDDNASKSQLGAKSRAKKEIGIPLYDLQKRRESRLTEEEKLALDSLLMPSGDNEVVDKAVCETKAMQFAKLHSFEQALGRTAGTRTCVTIEPQKNALKIIVELGKLPLFLNGCYVLYALLAVPISKS